MGYYGCTSKVGYYGCTRRYGGGREGVGGGQPTHSGRNTKPPQTKAWRWREVVEEGGEEEVTKEEEEKKGEG